MAADHRMWVIRSPSTQKNIAECTMNYKLSCRTALWLLSVTPRNFRDKNIIDSPSWPQFFVGFAMQIVVQRLKHSNRWRDGMQRKFAKIALKARRFLDWLNLKKNYF
jgi:hypothetical protein